MTITEYKQKPNIQKLITEIGQRVEPYVKREQIKFQENVHRELHFEFDDHEGNKIDVKFLESVYKSGSVFDVDFSVNNDSYQNFKTTMGHYFKILSTVIEVVNTFLKEEDPYMVKVNGVDKDPEHKGQKDKIYKMYAKSMVDDTDYLVCDTASGFVLSK